MVAIVASFSKTIRALDITGYCNTFDLLGPVTLQIYTTDDGVSIVILNKSML